MEELLPTLLFPLAVAADGHEDRRSLAGCQPHPEDGLPQLQVVWFRVEVQRRAPDDLVQAVVGEDHGVAAAGIDAHVTVARTRLPADLEQVEKIRIEAQVDGQVVLDVIEIVEGEAFVDGRFPDELGSQHVNAVLAQAAAARPVGVRVGEIDAEQGIVVLDGRAEEERPAAVQRELVARQEPGVFVEDALGCPLAGEDVAVVVEHGEGIAVLEGAGAPLQQRRGGRNVELHLGGIVRCFRWRRVRIVGCHGFFSSRMLVDMLQPERLPCDARVRPFQIAARRQA